MTVRRSKKPTTTMAAKPVQPARNFVSVLAFRNFISRTDFLNVKQGHENMFLLNATLQYGLESYDPTNPEAKNYARICNSNKKVITVPREDMLKSEAELQGGLKEILRNLIAFPMDNVEWRLRVPDRPLPTKHDNADEVVAHLVEAARSCVERDLSGLWLLVRSFRRLPIQQYRRLFPEKVSSGDQEDEKKYVPV